MTFATNMSSQCIDLVKHFEGFVPHPYKCSAGVWTIGYGFTCDNRGNKITSKTGEMTEEEADAQLIHYLYQTSRRVSKHAAKSEFPYLMQHQLDALTSFAYNLGEHALFNSTLWGYMMGDDAQSAADQFSRWIYAGGQPLDGLKRRRKAEAILFTGELLPEPF